MPTAIENMSNAITAKLAAQDNYLTNKPHSIARMPTGRVAIGSSAYVVPGLTAVDKNVGLGFSSATNRFTPPLAGEYLVIGNARIELDLVVAPANSTAIVAVEFLKNGTLSSANRSRGDEDFITATSGLSLRQMQVVTTLRLSLTDYLQLMVSCTQPATNSVNVVAYDATRFASTWAEFIWIRP